MPSCVPHHCTANRTHSRTGMPPPWNADLARTHRGWPVNCDTKLLFVRFEHPELIPRNSGSEPARGNRRRLHEVYVCTLFGAARQKNRTVRAIRRAVGGDMRRELR